MRTTDQHLRDVLITRAGEAAIRAAGGRVGLLLLHVEQRCEVRQSPEGAFHAVVLDERGNPRIRDYTGVLMSVEDLVAELKTDPAFAPAFEQPPQPDSPPANDRNPYLPATFNLTEQGRLMRTDPGRAFRLREEAERERARRAAPKPSGSNPFAKASLNLTEQGRILRRDPALAAQLKAAAEEAA